MDKAQALAIWKSIWRNITKVYGSPGHYGWDWPTLLVTFPERASILRQCMEVLNVPTQTSHN
jgi:hypothetical protein